MNIPQLSVLYKAILDAIDKRDQQLASNGAAGAAHVISGCGITLAGGMVVTIAAGTIRSGGVVRTFAGGSVTLSAGPSAPNSRVDLVYIDNTGALTSATGNAADPNTPPGPQDPALPAGACLIAIYLIPAGTATLTSTMQQDARVFGPQVFGQAGSATYTGAGLNTTSTTFVDAAGLTVTITTTGGDVIISFSAAVANNNAADAVAVTLIKDGANVGGTAGLNEVNTTAANSVYPISFVWRDAAPTAASHTYKIAFRTALGNTGTILGNPTASLVVQELPH